jgi:hypothetical protein
MMKIVILLVVIFIWIEVGFIADKVDMIYNLLPMR